jgi:hypothetical protein
MCGLEIHVEGGRVTGIRGNRDDVWSRGHICPKGVSLAALHDDPDRIRSPLIKVDGALAGGQLGCGVSPLHRIADPSNTKPDFDQCKASEVPKIA